MRKDWASGSPVVWIPARPAEVPARRGPDGVSGVITDAMPQLASGPSWYAAVTPAAPSRVVPGSEHVRRIHVISTRPTITVPAGGKTGQYRQ